MKRRRMLGLALALCVAASALALPVSAAYKDTAGHWAETYIEDVSARGVFKGYEDGTFRPYNNLTAAEALVVCGRVCGASEAAAASCTARWEDTLDAVLGTAYPWARTELAVCLEAGIVTEDELKTLHGAGALGKEMKKEDLSMYFVRAMGLSEMASGLSASETQLGFSDAADISESRRPYVYLLKQYGIVEGDTKNNFSPKLAVNRAVVATMLSRVLDFVSREQVSIELPAATTYSWTAGTVSGVSSGTGGAVVLTLRSSLSGEHTVTLADNAAVYRYNMKTDTSALQTGLYASAALDSTGKAAAVRLYGGVSTVGASVSGYTENSVTVLMGTVSKTLPVTRLTEVRAGRSTGDWSVIDPQGGYTAAQCTLDASGRLLALSLSGGTYEEQGLLEGVETSGGVTTLSLTGVDGVTRRVPLASGASVSVNGVAAAVSSSHAGSWTVLRVSDDTGEAVSAALDSVTQYVQGSVRSITLSKTPNLLGIMNLTTEKSVSYSVSPAARVTYAGQEIPFKEMQLNWFVTAKLDAQGALTEITANPGSTVTEGTLTGISYGATVTLEVTGADGSKTSFSMPVSQLPDFKRNGSASSLDKLKTGDKVRVTVRFNVVTLVESEPQQADVSGVITRIVQEAAGTTLELRLDDGSMASYTVTSAVSITSDGKAVAASALKVGYRLSLVTSGDKLISIEVTETAAAADRLSGTVLYVNASDKTILIQTADGSKVTVGVGSDTRLINVLGGNFSLLSLANEAGTAVIDVYGQYDGLVFNASVIIKY